MGNVLVVGVQGVDADGNNITVSYLQLGDVDEEGNVISDVDSPEVVLNLAKETAIKMGLDLSGVSSNNHSNRSGSDSEHDYKTYDIKRLDTVVIRNYQDVDENGNDSSVLVADFYPPMVIKDNGAKVYGIYPEVTMWINDNVYDEFVEKMAVLGVDVKTAKHYMSNSSYVRKVTGGSHVVPQFENKFEKTLVLLPVKNVSGEDVIVATKSETFNPDVDVYTDLPNTGYQWAYTVREDYVVWDTVVFEKKSKKDDSATYTVYRPMWYNKYRVSR